MKKIVTVGRIHGTNKWEVVLTPGNPRSEHRAQIRSARRAGNQHERYAELWMCTPIRVIYTDEPPSTPAQVQPPAKGIVQAVADAVKAVVSPAKPPEPEGPTPKPKKAQSKKKALGKFAMRVLGQPQVQQRAAQ